MTGGGARRRLADDLRARAFSGSGAAAGRRVGAEIELIPVERDTRRICTVAPEAARSSLALVRSVAAMDGWTEHASAKGAPVFAPPDGGTVTFEPGGQLEYSSAPCASASDLVDRLQGVAATLMSAADQADMELLSVGIDPVNAVEQVPLAVRGERYERMARHFASLGPFGARMMRQTASMQVNLDMGDEPWRQWRMLNALAPYLVAIFANSPVYAGHPTGHRSFRAHCWRTLDPARTGLPYADGDPVERYLDFALGAKAFLHGEEPSTPRPFGELIASGDATLADWNVHLTTLFPDVRPRGYFEIRSIDAIAPAWYAAPIALLSGLLYDAESFAAAEQLLGAPSEELLVAAGRFGVCDPRIGRPAVKLFELALAGCDRLGPDFLCSAHADVAHEFLDRYTRHRRSPADDIGLAD